MPYWCSNCGGTVPSSNTKMCPHCGVSFGYQHEGTIEQYVIAQKKFRKWRWEKFRTNHPYIIRRTVCGSILMLALFLCWVLSYALLSWNNRSYLHMRASLVTLVFGVAVVITGWRKNGLLEEIRRYRWTKYSWTLGIPVLAPRNPSPEFREHLLQQEKFLNNPFTSWERNYFYEISILLENLFSFTNLLRMILLVPRTFQYMTNLCVVIIAWLLTIGCCFFVVFL